MREEFHEQGASFCYLNGVTDHIHVLLSLGAHTRVSEVIEHVKTRSKAFMKCHDAGFLWQSGYAVLSVNPYDHKRLLNYICDQKQRHARDRLWLKHEW